MDKSNVSRPSTAQFAPADVRPGLRVFDIGSGAGEPALGAAERVAPGGFVLGVDTSEHLLQIAREKAARRGISNMVAVAAGRESTSPQFR